MSDVQSGFYWHVHHDVLIEWCYNYQERVDFIRNKKAESERELRLRLFRPVKGNLPEEVVRAGQVLNEAKQAYFKSRQAYYEARQAYDKTWRTYNEAVRTFDEALIRNKKAIEELHAKECPNCPWNGCTIFP